MNKVKNSLVFVLVLLVCLSTAACSKKELTLGEFQGNTYTNSYFGISMNIPEGWEIQNDETVNELMEAGKEAIAGDNAAKKAALDLAEQKLLTFFMICKYPIGELGKINPNVICQAEKVGSLVKNESEYLEAIRNQLESASQTPYNFKDIYTENLGGEDFYVLESNIDFGSFVYTQKYYTKIMDKYAFNIVVGYTEEEGKEEISQMLESVIFE
ncbi:MAG: hypothetical protein GX198_01965 [Epulopiscium sp.]|nr:hypothetical protein [Candidatus Epulonipiscium sp.]HOQ17450.1 hypothetical protein [Defluviitaleaceae bacterium]HPT76440.1 hypothetical protein [Defluviitaleaceae bacterium]